MNALFRYVLEANPFEPSILAAPSNASTSNEALHRIEFEQLLASAHQASPSQDSFSRRSLLILGPAGSGKTHLLTHFARSGDREGGVCGAVIDALTLAPADLPWSIVRDTVRQLADHRLGPRHSPLFRLMHKAVQQAVAELPPQETPYRVGQVVDAFRRLTEGRSKVAARWLEAHAINDALFRYFLALDRASNTNQESGEAQLAMRWLSGESLDSSEAAVLGIVCDEESQDGARLSGTESARGVLLAIAELTSLTGRLFTICFDKADGLTSQQVEALARFLQPLLVGKRKLLIVFAGQQQAALEQVQRVVVCETIGDAQSLDSRCIRLGGVSREQARQMLQWRLCKAAAHLEADAEVKRWLEHDPLFPLGSDWFDQIASQHSEFVPGEVVGWACERWQRQQELLIEMGGQAWLAQFSRPAPSAASSVPQAVLPVPATASCPAPVRKPRESRALDYLAWTTVAALVVALGAALWARNADSRGSSAVAQRSAEAPSIELPVKPLESRPAAQTNPAESSERKSPASGSAREEPNAASQPDRTVATDRPEIRQEAEAVATHTSVPTIVPPRVPDPKSDPTTTSVASPPARYGYVGPVKTGDSASKASPADSPAPRIASSGQLPVGVPTSVLFETVNSRERTVDLSGEAIQSPNRSQHPLARPLAIVDDPELERLLTEAWILIERGDFDVGRGKLDQARKLHRDDARADFSIGVLDALVDRNWESAAKKFAECLRRDPDNVPSLNNLAVAQMFTKHEAEAVKNWRTIVEMRSAAPEVVQNLGCVRQLIKDGNARRISHSAKVIDELYAEAALNSPQSAKPANGFRIMPLQLADGRHFGWARGRNATVPLPDASGSVADKRTPPAPTNRYPSAVPVGSSPPGASSAHGIPGASDPRVLPNGPHWPGTNGTGRPIPNMPNPNFGQPGRGR